MDIDRRFKHLCANVWDRMSGINRMKNGAQKRQVLHPAPSNPVIG
jgi:hypothetical protein